MEYLNKTLEEYAKESNSWLWGKIFILKSHKFGVHIFLCTKYPAQSYEDRTKFINLSYETADTYFYSSVCNDIILDMYEGIKSYDFAMKRYLMFKEEAKK